MSSDNKDKDILVNVLFDAFSNAAENLFIYVCDVKRDLSRWSKQSVDYFGLEGEYIENAGAKWVEHIHPEDREIYLKDIESVFSGKTRQHNCQYRARNRYGDYVWVECRGSMIPDENGDISVFAGMMTRIDSPYKYDNLTHLLTGYELQKREFPTGGGVMMLIGVNGFRIINSRHGFLYGNQLLVKLADILRENAKKEYELFRLQSDEFIVYAPGGGTENMADMYRNVERDCSALNLAEDGIASFTLSAGVVEFPRDGEDFSTLIGNMQYCIAFAKEDLNNNIEIFSEEIRQKQYRKAMVAEALNDSIMHDFTGFELFYQPIVDNENSEVISCEALLRWNPNNPEIGFCSPGEFIPILERNGSIIQVGDFVMRNAIEQAAAWQKQYKNLKLSFNVSYPQLETPDFIHNVVETAKRFQADPSKIIVELTESVEATNKKLVDDSFRQLREAGFMVAMDDFGTGNSSFALLHDISVDVLKLDQSFIRGLSETGREIDNAIVESIAFLCNKIHFQTVAEGIENEEIWNKIKEFGFTGLQGYLFSKPVPKSEFESFLEKHAAKN